MRIRNDYSAADALNEIHRTWRLKKPKLIISVIGALKDMHLIPYNVKLSFKDSLKSIIGNLNAWIITSGLESGIAKLVGDTFINDIN
jgi:hypothetical protein